MKSKARSISDAKPALRVDKRALFELVGYVPHVGQAVMHDSSARFRALNAGARFGKSMAAAMEVVVALLHPCPNARGWIVAPSRDLVDRIFERVLATFHEHFAGRIIEEDARTQRLVVNNLGGGRSEVRGKSADNAVSLRGESLDFLIIEEAAQLPDSTWEECLSARLIDRRGWALVISTPNGMNWFYQLVRRGQRNRDPDCASWTMPSWTNPHVDRRTIEEERKRIPAEVWDEQYAAKFLGVPDNSCDTCGRPDPMVAGSYVFVGNGEIPRCVDCHDFVDTIGHTVTRLWSNGSAITKVIVLRPGEDEPIAMPVVPAEPEPVPAFALDMDALDDLG